MMRARRPQGERRGVRGKASVSIADDAMNTTMMSSWPRLNVALAAILLACQATAPCQAGLFDWFRRKPKPVVVYQPVMSCCQGRTVVNYAPHTVYSTSWVRIPVTTYRPVATVDPVTCSQVTYMQPSTSYTWQAQRQPHVIYRPFLSHVAPAVAVPAASAPAMTAPAMTVPGVAPSLAPPSGQMGTMIQAPGPAPSAASPYPASPYPASPFPSGPASPSTGGTPADQPPRLTPGAAPSNLDSAADRDLAAGDHPSACDLASAPHQLAFDGAQHRLACDGARHVSASRQQRGAGRFGQLRPAADSGSGAESGARRADAGDSPAAQSERPQRVASAPAGGACQLAVAARSSAPTCAGQARGAV